MTRNDRLTRRAALRTGVAATGLVGVYSGVGTAESGGPDLDDGCYYQVDFVAGDPIETLGETPDAFYGRQNRLIQYVHGDESGITKRDTWLNSLATETRRCVDAADIRVDAYGGTASVSFWVASGCDRDPTLSLCTYPLSGGEFSFDARQDLLDAATGTFGPGYHELEVDLPCLTPLPEFEIDEPTTVTEPGVYVLTDDIEVTGRGVGIRIGDEDVGFPSNVEVVGNGYAVHGPGPGGTPEGSSVGIDAGEYLSGGPRGVTVRDLTVTGFDLGLDIQEVGDSVFRDLTVADNGTGFRGLTVSDSTFSGNVVRNSRRGDAEPYAFHFTEGFAGNRFEDNRIVGNDGAFFSEEAGNGNVFVANTVARNGDGIVVGGGDNWFGGNVVSENGGAGLRLDPDGSDNRLVDNTIRGNATGVILDGRNPVDGGSGADDDSVEANTIEGNQGDGVRLLGVTGSRVFENTVRDNGGAGIRLDDAATDNTVVDNVVCGNDGGAIVVSDDSTGNVVRNNTTDC